MGSSPLRPTTICLPSPSGSTWASGPVTATRQAWVAAASSPTSSTRRRRDHPPLGRPPGTRPLYSGAPRMGGRSFVSHLFHAAAAIDAGLCEVALIAYGSTQRSAGGRLVSGSETLPYEAAYRPRYPVSMYALAASRHMHEYGTTREQLAAVARQGEGRV